MKKIMVLILLCTFSIGLFAVELSPPYKKSVMHRVKKVEPVGNSVAGMTPGTRASGLRESNAVIIDSSQNGYGMIVSETNPISVNPQDHSKISLGYRQYSDGEFAGQIGMATSTDSGESWLTIENYNTGLSNNGGRYPSSIATAGYPLVLWNEYEGNATATHGVPYYSYDWFGWGGGYVWPAVGIHNNPAVNDSWIITPTQNIDQDGNFVMNMVMSDWGGDRDKIHFRAQSNGAFSSPAGTPISDSYTIVSTAEDFLAEFDTNGDLINYTANGNMDINSSGVGYYATVSFWGDTLEVENHTLFVKRTTDYGSTWSDWYYIPDETITNYFEPIWPDSLVLTDPDSTYYLGEGQTAFLGYDMDVLTDESGGLHVIAPVVIQTDEGIYTGWCEEVGLYSFYIHEDSFAAPNGPVQTQIGYVSSMQLGWNILDPPTGVTDQTPGYQQNGVSLAYDLNDEDRLYAVFYTGDTVSVDTSLYSFLEIMATESRDNGLTWSDPVNITDNGLEGYDETYPHMNRFGVDGQVWIMYQAPDYERPIQDEPYIEADYTNWLFFMKYNFGPTSIAGEQNALPETYSLENNYPNPFNPSTMISFNLPVQGMTKLTVFDITGREVQSLHNGMLNAGQHDFEFNAADLASGPYFYRLESANFQEVKKMLLIK